MASLSHQQLGLSVLCDLARALPVNSSMSDEIEMRTTRE